MVVGITEWMEENWIPLSYCHPRGRVISRPLALGQGLPKDPSGVPNTKGILRFQLRMTGVAYYRITGVEPFLSRCHPDGVTSRPLTLGQTEGSPGMRYVLEMRNLFLLLTFQSAP